MQSRSDSLELLERASARWDELVESDEGSGDRLSALRQELGERGIVVGERPLCTVLRPHLVTEDLLAHQSEVAAQVLSAAAKVRDAVLADEHLHRLHLGSFMEWVGELIEFDATGAADGALTRLDASLARTRLHFVELNADAPGGAGHHDSIIDFFEGLDTYERFAAEYQARPLRLIPTLISTLLEAWEHWGGSGRPSITMMTRTDDPVRVSSLEIEVAGHRCRGIDAEICDYRELSFEGGRLRAGDREVELLYRVMPTAECLELRAEMGPLFAAVRARAVCMVNPFRAELLGHKALFALMTDPSHDFGFAAAERAAVRDHVPWGRQLAEGRTSDAHGRRVDLVEHVLADREHLVLKPAHEFGGQGVLLGWHQDPGAWRAAVEAGLAADYIVQRRVPLHRADYPTLDAPGSRRSYFEDTDPFAFQGRVGGMLTRLSRGEITNVHEGGSVVASFAIAER
ncbi:MAG: hypothetical protein JJE23_00505 [Thermoleophilia bacterium]|nr:hypothetical protein [Thermoleophilia bacterium]